MVIYSGFLLSIFLIAISLCLPLFMSPVEKENRQIVEHGISTMGTISSVKRTMLPISVASTEYKMHEVATIDYRIHGDMFTMTATRQFQRDAWQDNDSVEVYYVVGEPKDAVASEKGIPGVEDQKPQQVIYFIIGLLLLGGTSAYSFKGYATSHLHKRNR